VLSVCSAALVLGGCGSSSSEPTSAAARSAVTTAPASWTVPISRSVALADGKKAASGGHSPTRVTAKLMTYGDWRRVGTSAVNPATPDSLQVWAVEAIGHFPVSMGPLPAYQWAIWLYNAHSGDVIGTAAGLGASPSYWKDLPDHSQ